MYTDISVFKEQHAIKWQYAHSQHT